jgi:hypothetical protein
MWEAFLPHRRYGQDTADQRRPPGNGYCLGGRAGALDLAEGPRTNSVRTVDARIVRWMGGT